MRRAIVAAPSEYPLRACFCSRLACNYSLIIDLWGIRELGDITHRRLMTYETEGRAQKESGALALGPRHFGGRGWDPELGACTEANLHA